MDLHCEFIHIKKNGVEGTSYPLEFGTEMVLGSDKSCDFRLQLPSVSEKHVKINVDDNGKIFISKIVDFSTLLLNGKSVNDRSFVPHDSIISIGSLKFKFRYPDAARTKSPKPNNENLDSNASTTPVLDMSKKRKLSSDKVPTPIPEKRNRSSSTRLSSLSTSLVSIPESTEPTPSPTTVKPLENIMCIAETKGNHCHSRKSVSFGPLLSPELFNKQMPPNTPIKRGSLPMYNLHSLLEMSGENEISLSEEDDELNSSDLKQESTGDNSDEFVNEIQSVHQSLPTPVKNDIRTGPYTMNKTKQSLSTPLKAAIISKPQLRATRRTLSTPVHNSIKTNSGLQSTKPSLPTPIKGGIRQRLGLKKARQSLPIPVKAKKPSKKIRPSMPTPLRTEIPNKPNLRKRLQSMPTPVRIEIQDRPSLRKTHKSLPTPIRTDIQTKPSLKKIKQALPTPLRNDIKSKPVLRKTLKSMPAPLQTEIKSRPALRKTLQAALPTPVRKEIQLKPSLRKTKIAALPTPVRNDIRARPSLRKTKRSLPTPIKEAIHCKPTLSRTTCYKSLPAQVRQDILSKPSLRKTKSSLPTPLRSEIEKKPCLRATKRSLPSPLKVALQAKRILKKTKLPSSLLDEIKCGYALQKTMRSLPTPIRSDIGNRPALKKTKHSLLSPVHVDINSQLELRSTESLLPTSVRNKIESCPNLSKVTRLQPTSLTSQVKSKSLLKHFNDRGKNSRKRNRSIDPSTPTILSEPARKKHCTNLVTPKSISLPRSVPIKKNIIENIPCFSPKIDAVALKNMFQSNTTTSDVDPLDYFEPFLFEAQEETFFVKQTKSRSKLSRHQNGPIRKSSRLQNTAIVTKSINNAASGNLTVIKTRASSRTKKMMTMNELSRKITEPKVNTGSMKTKVRTKGKCTAIQTVNNNSLIDTVFESSEQVTRSSSNNKATAEPLVATPLKKMNTRSRTKKAVVDSMNSNESNQKSQTTQKTLAPRHIKARRGKLPKNMSNESTSTVVTNRRITRSQKNDILNEEVKSVSANENELSHKNVKFATPVSSVVAASPMALRRSKRIRSH